MLLSVVTIKNILVILTRDGNFPEIEVQMERGIVLKLTYPKVQIS